MTRIINPTDLVGLFEAAEMLGVSKQSVQMWSIRYDDFPKPIVVLSRGRIWDAHDIWDWYNHNKREKHNAYQAHAC